MADRSNFDSQQLGWWKSESCGWVSWADRLWYRQKIHKQIKRSIDKILPSDWQQNLKCIRKCIPHPEDHISEDFEAIKRFVVTSYIPKSSKIIDFAEAGWDVFSKMQEVSQKKSKNGNLKDINIGKLSPHRRDSSTPLAFSNTSTCLAWRNEGSHQTYRSTRVWLETFRLRVYRDCNGRQHSYLATTDCVWGWKLSSCATQSCKNAARMILLARICVAAATNFVKMLIRRKFWKMIPVIKKTISTTKKERTTNSYLHIYVNCLLTVLVCFLFVYIFRSTLKFEWPSFQKKKKKNLVSFDVRSL